jgi:hypothetical protein
MLFERTGLSTNKQAVLEKHAEQADLKPEDVFRNDNPPVGIILCAGKNDALVKYATMGLSQQAFVSKYLINLPSEIELQRIITAEQEKLS